MGADFASETSLLGVAPAHAREGNQNIDLDYHAAPQKLGQNLMAEAETEMDDWCCSSAHWEALLGQYLAFLGEPVYHVLAAQNSCSRGLFRRLVWVDSFRASWIAPLKLEAYCWPTLALGPHCRAHHVLFHCLKFQVVGPRL